MRAFNSLPPVFFLFEKTMIELTFTKKIIHQFSIVCEIMKFKVWCQIWLPGLKGVKAERFTDHFLNI